VVTVTPRALPGKPANPRRGRFGRLFTGRRRSGEPVAGPDSPFTPGVIEVAARHLTIDGDWVACLAVTGYPREVHPGWLAPLIGYPGRLDLSLHVEPVDPVTAGNRLRRQLARFESGRRHTAEHGQLPDPHIEVAAEDAHELSERVARGEARLYRVGLYMVVHAPDEAALATEVAAVRALAASLLLDATPTTYRQLAAWYSCLPLGRDLLRQRRAMDTDALAAAMPFASPDLPDPDPVAPAPSGVLWGHNLASGGLLHWDRFAQENFNSVVLGRSGSGKSYLTKLEILRSLYLDIQTWVIDNENEYAALSHTVGGTIVSLGAPGVRLNPFDLPIHTGPTGRRTAHRDALTHRTLFLHTVLEVLLGELGPAHHAVLDAAITATYAAAGITTNPATWARPAPHLGDLATVLARHRDRAHRPVAAELAAQLYPYTHGAFADTIAGPTTTAPQGHLVVFNLRELPDELTALATLLTLDTIWRHVTDPTARRRRLVVVDEAWQMVSQPAGGRFLFRLAKTARRNFCGLVVATQDAPDLLSSPLGRAVVTNAATQILMRQSPQAIDQVSDAFALTAGSRAFLLRADRGAGLLLAGHHIAAFRALASPAEHRIATSDPHELAALAAEAEHATGDSGDTRDGNVAYPGFGAGSDSGWVDLDAA
jgi:type IV secretory system conjugative DNA transfer VirD4/TraG family protein